MLKTLGFERIEKNHYANKNCEVNLEEDYEVSIADNYGRSEHTSINTSFVLGRLKKRKYI